MRTATAWAGRRTRGNGARAAGAPLLLSLFCLCSCFARPLWVADWSGPLERLDGESLALFAASTALAERGELGQAVEALEELARRAPANMPVARALQDARLALEAAGAAGLGAVESGDGPGTAGELGSVGQLPDGADMQGPGPRSEGSVPAVVQLLMAARAETDPERARALVEQAGAAAGEGSMAWVHYARAHQILAADYSEQSGGEGKGHFEEAGEVLGQALELAPGHVPSRRLEAWMASRRGPAGRAAELLGAWLEAVGEDPRVSPGERRRARLDRARCLIMEGEAQEALAVLEDGGVGWGAAERDRHLLRAAAHEARGSVELALAEARAAVACAPGTFLPHIQEALLCEPSDPLAAAAAWERVTELSKETTGFSHLLETLRAKVHLERAAAAAASRALAEPPAGERVDSPQGGGSALDSDGAGAAGAGA